MIRKCCQALGLAYILLASPTAATAAPTATEANAPYMNDFKVALGMFNSGEYTLASEEFANFLAKHPKTSVSARAYFYLGESYYRTKQYQEAINAFKHCVNQHEGFKFTIYALLDMGMSQYRLKQYGDASSTFERLIKADQQNILSDVAAFWTSEALYHKGDNKAAIVAYTRFITDYPKSDFRPRGLYGRAWAYIDAKEAMKAASDFVALATAFPTHDLTQESRYNAGEQYYQVGKLAQALVQYREVAKGKNTNNLVEKSLMAAGWVLHDQKQFNAAATEFDRLATTFPKGSYAAEARYLQGYCLYQAKVYDKAASVLSGVQAAGGVNKGKAMYWHAQSLAQLKQFEKALVQYDAALAAKDLDGALRPRVMYDKLLLLMQTSAYNKAQDLAANMVTRYKDHVLAAEAQYQSILAADMRKDYKGGLALCAHFLSAYAKSPLAKHVNFAQGKFANLNQDYALAVTSYTAFLKSAKGDARESTALVRLGLAQLHLTKAPEAKSAFERVLSQFKASKDAPEAAFMLGKMAFEQKDFAGALSHLANFALRYPDSEFAADSRLYAGACYLENKAPRKTIAAVKPLLAKKTNPAARMQAFLYSADAYYQENDLEGVATHYRGYLAAFPEGKHLASVVHGLGVVQFKLKRFDKALASFEKLLGIATVTPEQKEEGMYLAGRCHEMLEQFDKSIARYNAVVKAFPKGKYRGEAQYRVISSHFKHKQYKACIASATDYLNSGDPEFQPVALYDRAWAYERLSERKKALGDFEAFLTKYATHELAAEVAFKVGELHYFDRAYAKSMAYYKQVLTAKGDAHKDRALYQIGSAQDLLNKPDEALASFETLLADYPKTSLIAETNYRVGELYSRKGNFKQSLAHYDVTVKANKRDAIYEKALLGRGENLRLLKNAPEAMKAYQDLLTQFPASRERSRAYAGLGLCQQSLGAFRDAMKSFGEAVKGETGESAARAQLGYGQCQLALKEYDSAIKSLLKVTILYGFDEWTAQALYDVGRCYQAKGDTAKRDTYYQRYLKQFPTGKHAALINKALNS